MADVVAAGRGSRVARPGWVKIVALAVPRAVDGASDDRGPTVRDLPELDEGGGERDAWLARSVKLVDQYVNDNAANGNVQPEGQGPAGDKTVFIEALTESAA